jgi:hypothetical protein
LATSTATSISRRTADVIHAEHVAGEASSLEGDGVIGKFMV